MQDTYKGTFTEAGYNCVSRGHWFIIVVFQVITRWPPGWMRVRLSAAVTHETVMCRLANNAARCPSAFCVSGICASQFQR